MAQRPNSYTPPLYDSADNTKGHGLRVVNTPGYKPLTTADAYTKNMFVMELAIDSGSGGVDGTTVLTVPIHSVSEQTLETETFQRGDGVTGVKHRYHGGIKKFGEVTIEVIRDPSDPEDNRISTVFYNFMQTGGKTRGKIVKYHHGAVVAFEIIFEGLAFKSRTTQELSQKDSGEYKDSYACGVDFWYERQLNPTVPR